ncbi:FAD:protein FMN transferase, partial [Pectobacterium brasiliense]
SRFNQDRGTDPQPISNCMEDIFLAALRIGKATHGAMYITVGPFVNLCGLGPKKQPTLVPSQQQNDAARQHDGLRHLKLIGGENGEWIQ